MEAPSSIKDQCMSAVSSGKARQPFICLVWSTGTKPLTTNGSASTGCVYSRVHWPVNGLTTRTGSWQPVWTHSPCTHRLICLSLVYLWLFKSGEAIINSCTKESHFFSWILAPSFFLSHTFCHHSMTVLCSTFSQLEKFRCLLFQHTSNISLYKVYSLKTIYQSRASND